MLHSLRAFAKTPIAKVMLAILVVSFGAFGISNVVTNLGSTTVARVGDQEITATDFQRAYQDAINSAAQQVGKMPTPQEAVAMGIPSQVISRLAADASVNGFAQKFGLGASEERLIRILQQDQSFQGPTGKFDEAAFQTALRQNGVTQAQYFADATKSALRQQVALGLFGDAAVPDAAQQLANRYANDTRTLNYFVLNAVSIGDIAKPTDKDLGDYLVAHQGDYRTKETRTVDVLTLSPQALAAGKTFTDAEVSTEYDRTKASLVKIEQRHIQQVTLTADQATAFEAGKAAGKSFEQLVADQKLKPTDLGNLTQNAITDATLGKAAFGMKQGDFTLIPGISGKRAITVTAIEPGGQISLADAKADIMKSLALTKAKAEFGDKLDEIENLRAANQPMSAIVQRFGLKLATVAVTAGGDELAAVPDIIAADRTRVATAIFAAEQGKLTPSIALNGSQSVWFDLKSVMQARDQTLVEVRDAIAKVWTKQKTDEALKAEVGKLTDALKAGKSFDDVASSVNQFPILSQPITRQGDKTAGDASNVLNATVAAAAFEGGPGHFGSAVDGDGDYVVFKVDALTPSSTKASDQARTAVDNSIRDSLYGDFIVGLRQDDGLKTNQSALNQLLALDPSGN